VSILCLAPAWATAAGSPASVIVFSRGIGGTASGNGFIVGDGTLLVTRATRGLSRASGGRASERRVRNDLQPVSGDACEAEVVAQDRALDVVISGRMEGASRVAACV
jgi:hypothetical protein